MEIYLMDQDFNKYAVVDQYKSFIWTERWYTAGDFELVIAEEDVIGSEIYASFYIGHSDTITPMAVETVIGDQDDDGAPIVTIKGRSLLAPLFENRAVPVGLIQTGTAAQLAAGLVNGICVDGAGISPYDVIPGLIVQNMSASTDVIQITTKLSSLYDTITTLAKTGNFGFQLTWALGSLNLYIKDGDDRPNVVFSTDLDTLDNVSYLTSNQNYKNVAYVLLHDNTVSIQVLPGDDLTISGMDRRVLVVDASSLDPADYATPEDYNISIRQRAYDALAAQPFMTAIDGDAIGTQYQIGISYFLGDIVRSRNNIIRFRGDPRQYEKMQVTEYITASDATGFSSYPTLVALNDLTEGD